MQSGRSLPTFQRYLLPPSTRTPETSANFYQTTRRYNPEDIHLHTRRREKSFSENTDQRREHDSKQGKKKPMTLRIYFIVMFNVHSKG
jgi:hypothetical protein